MPQAYDAAMHEVLTQAELRSGGREDLDVGADVFRAHYLDKDAASEPADDALSGKPDERDAGVAQASSPLQAHSDAHALRAGHSATPVVATLVAEIVNTLAVIDKDGRRAVRMDLRHAKLPRTSVTLENLPERLQVVFESGDATATDLLGREIPHLAASIAMRRRCDCSVLVNTAPPRPKTVHRSDAAWSEGDSRTSHEAGHGAGHGAGHEAEAPAIRSRMA